MAFVHLSKQNMIVCLLWLPNYQRSSLLCTPAKGHIWTNVLFVYFDIHYTNISFALVFSHPSYSWPIGVQTPSTLLKDGDYRFIDENPGTKRKKYWFYKEWGECVSHDFEQYGHRRKNGSAIGTLGQFSEALPEAEEGMRNLWETEARTEYLICIHLFVFWELGESYDVSNTFIWWGFLRQLSSLPPSVLINKQTEQTRSRKI